jgi:hypothetical protein
LSWETWLTLLGFLWASSAARAEEKIEPVDAEFLEYLAELEGAEEDWTLFERETRSETEREARTTKPPPKPSASKPAAERPSKQP